MQSRQSSNNNNNNKRNGMSLTTINHGRLSGRVCALCLGVPIEGGCIVCACASATLCVFYFSLNCAHLLL